MEYKNLSDWLDQDSKMLDPEPFYKDEYGNKHLLRTDKPGKGLVTWAADVEIKPREWLWKPYLIKNNLNLLGGVGGIGKTYLLTAISSAISTGIQPEEMPGELMEQGNVLYFGSEDGKEEVARRLEELGADMLKVAIEEEVNPIESARVKLLIEEVKPKLLIFDALISYFPHGYNPNAQQDVRQIMDKLRVLAREKEMSIITVVHPGKNKEYELENRFGGSKAFVDSVRNAIYIGHHPTEAGARVGVQVKTNLEYAPPFQFTIDKELGFLWQGDAPNVTAKDVETAEVVIESKDSQIEEYFKVIEAVLKVNPGGFDMEARQILEAYSKLIPHKFNAKSFGSALNSKALIALCASNGIELKKGSNAGNRQRYVAYYKKSLQTI